MMQSSLFCFRRWSGLLLVLSLALFGSFSAKAGTVYVGNELLNGLYDAPDMDPPFVILGEYNRSGPSSTSSLTVCSGTIQDVKFFGQGPYDFFIYVLAYGAPGQNPNEQTFLVEGRQQVSGYAANEGIQTITTNSTGQALNIPVTCGNLLAFASIGPWYPQQSYDAADSDATYGNSSYYGNLNINSPMSAYTATPPLGPPGYFTVGLYGDTNVTYEYIPDDIFGNQGRTYCIGFDIQPSQTNSCISVLCPNNITVTVCDNSTNDTTPVQYPPASVTSICCAVSNVVYSPPSGTRFAIGTTNTVSVVAYDTCCDVSSQCTFTVTVLATNCPVTNANGCQVFNTGMGGPDGNIALAPGTTDPNFILISSPFGAGSNAVISAPLGPNWLVNSFRSQWISPEEDSSNSPVGPYHYRLQFNLACTNTQLTGQMAVDDTAGLFLNGQPVDYVAGWTSFSPVNLTGGFVVGNNTLDIYVTNTDEWTGLRAELTNCFSCVSNCLTIQCPPGVEVAGCGANGVALGDFPPFSVEVTDTCCNPNTVMISYSPPVVFAGTTTVTATATDACSNMAECSFPVTVIQITNPPPVIDCPSNIVVDTACASAEVYYTVNASSAYCSNVSLSVNPPSGSFFPIGTNTVCCVATDRCGNSNYCCFTVTVNQNNSCVAGITWTPQNSGNQDWVSVASSGDGSRLVALGHLIPIYTSTDSGVTWTAQNSPLLSWYAAASSSDGSKLVAAVQGGQIYTSVNYGTNWTARNSGSANWSSVASSSDGSRLVAVVGEGQIYTSINYGTNWTAQNSGSQSWDGVASSSDGSRLVAVANDGVISTSTDYGTNWTAVATTNYWRTVASSYDGSKLVAPVGRGRIFTSTDYGTNWTAQNSGSDTWEAVACSSDGSKLVAVALSGDIATSTDFGTNWTAQNTGGQYWYSVASSAGGCELVAANSNFGLLYTSDGTPPACCVPPPTNMVLWLPFDETSGSVSANLASPADYGTQVNHPTPLLGSYVANSLLFDGTNYVTVPDYSHIEIGTSNLTIDAWVNEMDSTLTNYVILDKRSTQNGAGYSLWLNPGQGLVFNMSGPQAFVEQTPISTMQWHFVAVDVSLNPPQGFFYVDGAVAGTFTPSAASFFNTNALWVGAGPVNPFGTAPSWVGALDEVEVYNRALSTNELYGIYSAGMAGKCKPCCYLNVISISKLPGNSKPPMVEITWGGCGILQEATNLLGPWTPIQNAASPYVTPATGTDMFYQLVCP